MSFKDKLLNIPKVDEDNVNKSLISVIASDIITSFEQACIQAAQTGKRSVTFSSLNLFYYSRRYNSHYEYRILFPANRINVFWTKKNLKLLKLELRSRLTGKTFDFTSVYVSCGYDSRSDDYEATIMVKW